MHLLILHDEPGCDARPDELDTLVQADHVASGLRALSHTAEVYAVGLDLGDLARRLESAPPALVFNLVESLGGYGRLIACVPMLLEALRIPSCGASAAALEATSHKPRAKQAMREAGLPTPDWIDAERIGANHGATESLDGLWILKSIWEHASLGLDEDSVLEPRSRAALGAELERRLPSLGGRGFAERFVAGREFNLSLLGRAGKPPQILPVAEIVFEAYADSKPRVVGWRAKWDPTSFEYSHTPRRFSEAEEDAGLREELERLSLACWELFELNGWARVDFRVDEHGQPYILEVNANPCLAPDAGFAAALERAGLTFPDALRRILEDRPRDA